MEPSSAIVVAIDRLSANFLGPYGNTWVETPEFNRLASESLLCEFAMTDSPHLDVAYRSFWEGTHALGQHRGSSPSLPALLAERGVHAVLLTDDSEIAQHPLAADFAERITLPEANEQVATGLEQTGIAQLFAAAIEQLEQLKPPYFLWVHSRGMAGPWDGPLELRNRFAEEDDPTPPEFTEPPERRLEKGFDPDELLGVTHAYAGQVVLLDICLGALLDAVDRGPAAEQPLLGLVSPRGYPLGEHLRIGGCDNALYEELLHVPWFLRFPEGRFAARRTQMLVQSPDLFMTLLEALKIDYRNDSIWSRSLLSHLHNETTWRDRACATNGKEGAIRTPAWLLSGDLSPETAATNPAFDLYVKPDDRWEVNEVSDRCSDVVEQLLEAYEQFCGVASSAGESELAPLSELLSHGLD